MKKTSNGPDAVMYELLYLRTLATVNTLSLSPKSPGDAFVISRMHHRAKQREINGKQR